MQHSRLFPFALGLVLAGTLHCSDEASPAECTVGITQLCLGEDNCPGAKSCNAEGWGQCVCDDSPQREATSGPYRGCGSCPFAITIPMRSCESLGSYFREVEEPVARCVLLCQFAAQCGSGEVCVNPATSIPVESRTRQGICLKRCTEQCPEVGWACRLASIAGDAASPGGILEPQSVCLPVAEK